MIKGREGENRYRITGTEQSTGKQVQKHANNANKAIAIMIEMMKNGILNVNTKRIY